MHYRIIFFFVLSLVIFPSFAQPLTLLKKIGKPTPNSLSGLTQSFYGKILNDGNLYFDGSYDGFNREQWRTDGTTAGTEKIFTESTTGEWKILSYTSKGIFINTADDHLSFYDIGSGSFTDLGFFEDEDFTDLAVMDPEHYIYFSHDIDSFHLYITDRTAAGTHLLGTVGKYTSFTEMYASPFGAVVYNTSPFANFTPLIYLKATNQIVAIKDFLAPYKTVTRVDYAVVYDHYMFLSVVEAGFTKYYTFDFLNQSFHPAIYFFSKIEAFYPHGNELIIVSEREIATMDTTTYTMHQWTEKVFPLGVHIVRGDSIFYHGYSTNDSIKLHIYNANTHEIKVLENSFIGFNHYGGGLELHKGSLYYTHDSGPTIFLRKYNFQNQNFTDIDSITVRNGGASITNGVIEVNGVLLVSKFTPEMGHELYYFNGTTGTHENAIQELNVFPNPCHEKLIINTPEYTYGKLMIVNILGQKVMETIFDGQAISVSVFTNGLYTGILESGDLKYQFRFIKD